jgi:hypothetical protein
MAPLLSISATALLSLPTNWAQAAPTAKIVLAPAGAGGPVGMGWWRCWMICVLIHSNRDGAKRFAHTWKRLNLVI